MNQAAEVIPANLNQVELYSEFRQQLAELKRNNETVVFDYASAKGNKEARSHVYSLRKVNAALEKARKDAKAAALEYGRLVDSKAKEIGAELDAMIALHEIPLLEIENKEKARIAAIQARLQSLDAYMVLPPTVDAATIADELASVEAFQLDDSLAEFKAHAAIAKDAALVAIKTRLAERLQYEQEQAELARLRAEAEARAKADREAAIAKEAAERATREAEVKALRDKQQAEREQQERERMAEEKQRQAELAVAQAKQREAEAIARAAQAEHEAKERAEREHAAKLAAEKAESERREQNQKHKAKINNEILAALIAAGLTDDQGKCAIKAIANGVIPHVRIQY